MIRNVPASRAPSFQHPGIPTFPAAQAFLLVLIVALATGCSASALNAGRRHFYNGHLDKAGEALLDATKLSEKDKTLFLMDRGTVRQMQGHYDESSRDYIAAHDELQRLETYSLSKGAGSLVINDGVQNYIGTPYERSLLHAFTAKNHMAIANWDDAAVEARRIIQSLEPREEDGYPQDGYTRYMAGFCLEMIDDLSNAQLQYRLANRVLKHVEIDEVTGHLRRKAPQPTSTNAILQNVGMPESPRQKLGPAASDPWLPDRYPNELICFVLLGRSPSGTVNSASVSGGPGTKAEVYHNGALLGPAYPLADTVDLTYRTEKRQAAVKAAKTVTRVVIKEGIAGAVASNTDNEALGMLTRFILIAILERPDVRRWETLPRWLMVARVPCPPDIDEFDVVVTNKYGKKVRTVHVTQPITRRGNKYVSFCRDLPISSALPTLPKPAAEK